MGKPDSIWQSRTINTMLKARLLQPLAWSIVTHGSQAWTRYKDTTCSMQAFDKHEKLIDENTSD